MYEDCLDTDELAAMISGGLAADRVEAILGHVDGCSTCAEVIANLGRLDNGAAALGRYELGHVLGAGAMGVVYEAWDPQLRRKVALKLVRPERADEAARDRMLREARALARVSHPNVVTVYDVGEHGGEICVATELVEGETMATWQLGRPKAEVIEGWLQAARGLAAAHAGGVVHRDIKPANVLVGVDGRVRVGDFGLASLGAELLPVLAAGSGEEIASPADAGCAAPPEAVRRSIDLRASCIAGTPAYMAPEQQDGRLDARSDQFSLCVGLAEALTTEHAGADAVPAVEPQALRDVIARGLRANPDERFPSMAAFVDALAAAVAPPPSRRWPFAAAGAAIAIGGAVALLLLLRTPAERCEVVGVPAKLWSPARRAQLAHDIHETVAARADRWLAAWAEASADVCVTDRDDATIRDRRRRCLDELLGDFTAKLDSLKPGMAIADAHQALEDNPLPMQCAHAVVATAKDPTIEQRLQYMPIRVALHAREPTHDELIAMLAQTRAIGFAPYAAEVAGQLVDLESNTMTSLAAAKTSREAMTYADAHGDDLNWTILAINLTAQLAGDRDQDVDALDKAIRTRIAKLGGDRELEAGLDVELGQALAQRARLPEAIESVARAVASFRLLYGTDSVHVAYGLNRLAADYFSREPNTAHGLEAWTESVEIFHRLGVAEPPPPMPANADPKARVAQYERYVAAVTAKAPESIRVVDGEWGLATAYVMADDDKAALLHYERAVALADKLHLRTDHVAYALSQIAALFNDAHRFAEAAPIAKRAIEMAEQLHLDPDLASALGSYGYALVELGDDATAREVLTRGLDLRERIHDPPRLRALTRFQLARATWSVDRDRAHRLLGAAREDLQLHLDSLKGDSAYVAMTKKEAAEIIARMDAWRRSHPN